jgi:hypothetical protein
LLKKTHAKTARALVFAESDVELRLQAQWILLILAKTVWAHVKSAAACNLFVAWLGLCVVNSLEHFVQFGKMISVFLAL